MTQEGSGILEAFFGFGFGGHMKRRNKRRIIIAREVKRMEKEQKF